MSLNLLDSVMASSDSSDSAPRLRLSDLSSGERARVHSLEGEANLCSRLREMGFCESAVVEKLSGNHTMLCQVCGTRVALNGRIAQNIVVEKLEPR